MKAMVCEMCGGNNLVKENGVFVCQSCGTKYSVEEARKLLVEGVVKIDNSEKVEKLYQLARAARDNSDIEGARNYYEQIKIEKPDDWEAAFYSLYFRLSNCMVAQIEEAATVLQNALVNNIFIMLLSAEMSDEERFLHVAEIVLYTRALANTMWKAAEKNKDIMSENIDNFREAVRVFTNRSNAIFVLLHALALSVEIYRDKYSNGYKPAEINKLISDTEKDALDVFISFKHLLRGGGETLDDTIQVCVKNVRLTYPSYVAPTYDEDIYDKNKYSTANNSSNSINRSGGCYVATAVYGSYDCPEVWTLRRYRDDTLAKTWYGRVFIRTYYTISPTLVKWFGKTNWFKGIWKPKLDRLVQLLNSKGVSNEPYNDMNS